MQMHACIYVCKKPKHGSSSARALGSFYITRAISLPHSTQLQLKNWLGENAKHGSIARAPGSFCIRRAISLSLSQFIFLFVLIMQCKRSEIWLFLIMKRQLRYNWPCFRQNEFLSSPHHHCHTHMHGHTKTLKT